MRAEFSWLDYLKGYCTCEQTLASTLQIFDHSAAAHSSRRPVVHHAGRVFVSATRPSRKESYIRDSHETELQVVVLILMVAYIYAGPGARIGLIASGSLTSSFLPPGFRDELDALIPPHP
jgi:hypothetical protein